MSENPKPPPENADHLDRAAPAPSSQTKISLRRASDEDIPAIAEIENAAFANPAERFNARKIRSLLRSHRTHVLVAELKGTVIGWVAGITVLRGARPWGRIYALAVHPTRRGRKLGTTLVREMILFLQ